MRQNVLVSIASYFGSLIWIIIILIFIVENDITLSIILFFLLVFPNLICAVVHTYRHSGLDQQASLKESLFYLVGFIAPLFNVGLSVVRILTYQDAEGATLLTFFYTIISIISSIGVSVLVLPEIPWLYSLEIFFEPTKNQTVLIVFYILNTIFYFFILLCSASE